MSDEEKKFQGDKVRDLLETRRWAVVDLAKKAGVSQGALSNWLNGIRNPKRANIKAIADALDCKVSDISAYSDEELSRTSEDIFFDFEIQPDHSAFLESVYEELCNQVTLEGQAKVAERLGVSQSHVRNLYIKNTAIGNLSLLAFLNLFPRMRIMLRGSKLSDPIEEIQAITECLSQEEAEKLLAVLKIVFPQYVNSIK